MDWRFTTILLVVSALAGAALVSLRAGVGNESPALGIVGATLALVTLLGVAALARLVVLHERARRNR